MCNRIVGRRASSGSTSMRTATRCTGTRKGGSFTATTAIRRCHFLRRAPVGSADAPIESGCLGGQHRSARTGRGAASPPLAEDADSSGPIRDSAVTAVKCPVHLSPVLRDGSWCRLSTTFLGTAAPTYAATFGAGTIIDCRNGSPSPPCGTSPGSPDPRETGRHRASPTTRHLRAAPATATLGGSDRPPGVWLPSMVRLPAPGIEYGCFRNAYGGLRCLDGRIVGVGTRASQGWTIRGRVRRISRRIPRTGQTGVLTNSAAISV